MSDEGGPWWLGPKPVFFYMFLICWILYAIQTRWAARLYFDVFSKFVGFVAFQYNKGFRQKFMEEFIMREPPKDFEPITSEGVKEKSVDTEQNEDDRVYPPDYHLQMSRKVSYSIDQFLAKSRRIPYNITRSYSNEVAQRLNYYLHEYQEDIIKENACFKMMNVDYYADMEHWLTFMKPIIMYTFVPEGVAGKLSTGSFSCKHDIWSIIRADGVSSDHMVWDYGYEYCTIETCWGVVICPIEQFRMVDEPHFRVVCIIPATFVPVPFSMLVQRRSLERLKVTYHGMNLLRFVDVSGRELLSMASLGSSVDYLVPSDLFDILNMRNNSTRSTSLKSIEQFLKQEGVPKEFICATLIHEVFKYKRYPPAEGRMPRVPMCEDVKYEGARPTPERTPKLVLKPLPRPLKPSKESLLLPPKPPKSHSPPTYNIRTR